MDKKTNLTNNSAMGKHFNLLICILLFKSTKGQIIYDSLDGRQQNSLNSAVFFIKNELQQLTKSIEKLLVQKLEEYEDNLQTKISRRLEDVTKNAVENFTIILENKFICARHSTLMSGSDCADILKRNPIMRGKDGVYNIIDVSDKLTAVYCDMTTDNGGWTVIQRRINGSVDFYLNWTEYKNGFGFADHEYWIGNDLLHRLTSLKPQELRVDMESFNGEKAYAVYSTFSVGDEVSKYRLQVNGYRGNAGDGLSFSNNNKFSTPDQDNDGGPGHCATDLRSAGWFSNCFFANPNGQYSDSEINGPYYMQWYSWKNSDISLKTFKMMIRLRV